MKNLSPLWFCLSIRFFPTHASQNSNTRVSFPSVSKYGCALNEEMLTNESSFPACLTGSLMLITLKANCQSDQAFKDL